MIQLSVQPLPYGASHLSMDAGTRVISVLPNGFSGIDLHLARNDSESKNPLEERDFYVVSPWGSLPSAVSTAIYIGGCAVPIAAPAVPLGTTAPPPTIFHVFEITSAKKEELRVERNDATSQLIRIAHNLQI